MNKSILPTLIALLLAPPAVLHADDMEETFKRPDNASKPACYWYWMFGNIASTGLIKELGLMQRIGIGEVFAGDIWTRQNDAQPGPVTALSPTWWHALTLAVREGGRTANWLHWLAAPD